MTSGIDTLITASHSLDSKEAFISSSNAINHPNASRSGCRTANSIGPGLNEETYQLEVYMAASALRDISLEKEGYTQMRKPQ